MLPISTLRAWWARLSREISQKSDSITNSAFKSLSILVIIALLIPNMPALSAAFPHGSKMTVDSSDAETPIPTPVDEPTDPADDNGRPTPGTHPTETPTPLPTETPAPTTEPTVTATPVFTATPTVTITPVATEAILDLTPKLEVKPDEKKITAGEPVTLTWSLKDGPVDPSGWLLSFALPEGIDPIGEGFQYFEPISRTLNLPLEGIAGSVPLTTTVMVGEKPEIIANLLNQGQWVDSDVVRLNAHWKGKADPSGGEVAAFGGEVLIHFPEQALDEAVELDVAAPGEGWMENPMLGGRPFEAFAIAVDDGTIIHEFTQPITIEISYDESRIVGDESTLSVFYYDETLLDWFPLPGRVITATNTLIGWTTHFSLFDYEAQNWEAARLPSLSGFQVSSFTGSGSYSYPIQVPPGPAGFQPSLTLSYNSQIVDGAASKSQASWVGMGWNIGESYIQRNMHGTPAFYGTYYEDAGSTYRQDDDWLDDGSHGNGLFDGTDGDDTFSLVVNGQSWTLLRIPDTDNNENTIDYVTEEESFWRIRRYHSHSSSGYLTDLSSWVVWDKSGIRYTFASRVSYPVYPGGCQAPFMQTWQWSLSSITDKFNQVMTYTYNTDYPDEPLIKNNEECPGQFQSSMWAAVYPETITYPNGRYKILFVRDESRTDYDTAWGDQQSTVLFRRSKLTQIQIWHDADGNWDGNYDGNNEAFIRKYVFTYSTNLIFPGVTWTAGGETPALLTITEYGSDGTTHLPVTTFTYGDQMHLTLIDNGYGGQEVVDYTNAPWYDDYDISNESDRSQDVGDCELPLWGEAIIDTTRYLDQQPSSYCSGISYQGRYFQPKGEYKIQTRVDYVQGGNGSNMFKVGIDYGGDILWGADTSIGYNQTNSFYFVLPIGATKARPVYTCWKSSEPLNNSVCNLQDITVSNIVTRYLVEENTGQDTTTSEDITYSYHYDSGATNDAVHSDVIHDTIGATYLRYSPGNSEFRGFGMMKSSDQNGRVTENFYYQDDYRRGQMSATLVMTESLTQPFESTVWNDYSSLWTYSGSQPTFPRIDGDLAAKMTAGASLYRTTDSTTRGEMALVQFRLADTTSQAYFAIETGTFGQTGYYRWGIKSSGGNLLAVKCATNDSACTTARTMITGYKANAWYALIIIVDDLDDDHFLMYLWEVENPENANGFDESMSTRSNLSWRFMEKTASGTAYIDEFSEGRLYSFNVNKFATNTALRTIGPLPVREGAITSTYAGLDNTWTYPTETITRIFEGDSNLIAKRTTYEYKTNEQNGVIQYGNQTRVLEAWWNPTVFHWIDYRLTRTLYYPKDDINQTDPNLRKYLVGLPAVTVIYECPVNSYDGTCSSSYPSYPPTAWAKNSTWFLYDNHTYFGDVPTAGKLTGQRVLLYCLYDYCTDNSNQSFSDTTFGYDAWGNLTSTTVYTGEGSWDTLANSGAQTTTACYGSGTYPNCSDDGYHTFMKWQANHLGHSSRITYDPVLAVPLSIIDPNGIPTSAAYDLFGRITSILRDGDQTYTMQFSYSDNNTPFTAPFYTQAEQKISGTTSYKIRKFYNGLGRLIQTQIIDANGSSTSEIVADFWIDPTFNQSFQSIPYSSETGGAYHNPSYEYYSSIKSDILGRPLRQANTAGQILVVKYSDGYDSGNPYFETCQWDLKNYKTCTRSDVWGRSIFVDAPTGPDIVYSYDILGRLLTVVTGGATTTLTYDMAGRKTMMVDPDMGTWTYAYDALGNLIKQRDAFPSPNLHYTCLYYDDLNRLTGKVYQSISACLEDPTSLAVEYTYDEFDSVLHQYGIGRRTGMTDSSGTTIWRYDPRGRLTFELKEIGTKSYGMSWAYNSADLVLSMTYPGGEIVTYSYNNQLMPTSVNGQAAYVNSTSYDATGRILTRNFNGGTLATTYTYNGWNDLFGPGLLDTLTTSSNPGALQSLSYTYDVSGNVLTISDYLHGIQGNPQTQTFEYDAINRLTSAVAVNGSTGNYVKEYYTYDPGTGNLATKAGVGYTYSSSTSHKVTQAGSNSYSYDANGNMINRTVSGTPYTLIYDEENRLTEVKIGAATQGSFTYNGDGKRVREVIGGTQVDYVGNYYEVSEITSSVPKQPAGNLRYGIDCYDSATGSGYLMYSEESVHERFSANPPNANNADHFICVKYISGQWKYDRGTGTYYTFTRRPSDILMASINFGTDTITSLQGTNTTEYGIDKGYASGDLTYLADKWNGQTDDGEFSIQLACSGGLCPLQGFTPHRLVTERKYYYAGSTRIAMSVNGVIKYLFGDHLGSTSVIAKADGTKESERGYKPWGEQRYGSAGVTSFGFTGQRDSSVAGGIMYYGARWYDESLGRFIQPDTIVPEPYNPLAYDRYQYVYSNPVRYTDSSGHCIDGVTTWACLVFLGGLILKAIDYGWTAYDTYQSGTVLADPGASREDKLLAGLNVGLAIIFEAGEPDDLLPVGLPVDDLGRRAIMKGAKEAFEEGGEEALEKFIRENLGDYADDVLKKMGLVDDYKVLQTGGHTLTKDTLAGLKLTQNEAHLALNRFKQHYHLRNDFHGIIMNNGDILDPNTRKVIGNLYEFVP